MEVHDISYFRNLWQTTVTDLENHCEIWENICKVNPVPDDVQEEIRSTIGLSRLLKNQKLKQFNGLIDDSEFNTGEKEITSLDLEGFWDMVSREVEKIKKSFSRLQECKNNEWKFSEEGLKSIPKKKQQVLTDSAASKKKIESSQSHALAAKQRLAEIKKKMLSQRKQEKDQNFVKIELSKEIIKTDNAKKENTALNGVEPAVLTSEQQLKETKQSPKRSKMGCATSEIVESVEESLNLSNSRKNTPAQRKGRSLAKDKENTMPADEDCTSKVKKSKENLRTPASEKKVKETEFIKLQCVTRSAKKRALLAQQNGKENS